ncbi:MAG TPA: hypothetical protein VH280_05570 [Verrucomicrobiae bacterium]|jgi:hypothetical protein|nr:hypothetical protein [Verrucomicrobiae bacterium]
MPLSEDKPKKREWVRDILDFIFTFKNKRGEIWDAWLYSSEGVSIRPQEFYASVEKRLESQKIPKMAISRIEFAEGGLLSDQRQYMRLMRERLAIDTCAAPFGAHFFFSCRVVHVKALVRLWHIVAAFAFFAVVTQVFIRYLGLEFAMIALVSLLFAIAAVFRNATSTAFSDLDTFLLKIPVVGIIYENWFRTETYYRIDTRTLYQTVLPNLIRAAAEEVCGEKGLKMIQGPAAAPILTELYRPTR